MRSPVAPSMERTVPGLHELQRDFRAALLAGDAAALAPFLLEDGMSRECRLDVYRNNIRGSLSAVLAECFPAVRRLVDARFFDYAAQTFIAARPPGSPCLHDYGAAFPDFLAEFPPCRELVYLSDVARLEWLLHSAAFAAEASPIAAAALASVPAEETPALMLRFHPSLGLLESAWPIDRIWAANRPGRESEETIDLAEGGVRLEATRRGGTVMLRRLDAPAFAFRSALLRRSALEAAAAAALERDAGFDVAAELGALFREGLVTEISR